MSADLKNESDTSVSSNTSEIKAWKSVLENIVSFVTASKILVENINNKINPSTNPNPIQKSTEEKVCIGDCSNAINPNITVKSLTSPEFFLTDFPFFLDNIDITVASAKVSVQKPTANKFDFSKWNLSRATPTSPKRGSRSSSRSSKFSRSASATNLYKSSFTRSEKTDKFANNKCKSTGVNKPKVKQNNAIVGVRTKVSKETLTKSKFRNNIKALITNSNDLREPIKEAILLLEKENNKDLQKDTDNQINCSFTPRSLSTSTEMLEKKFENLKPALQESSKPVKVRAKSPEELIAQKSSKLQKKKSKVKATKSPTRIDKPETKKTPSLIKKEENIEKSISADLFKSANKLLRPKSVASNVKPQKNYANIHNLQTTPSIPLKLFTTTPKSTKSAKAKVTANQKESKSNKNEGKTLKKPRTAPDKAVPSFELEKKAENIQKVVAKKSKSLKKESKKKVEQSPLLEKEKVVVEKSK